MGLDFVTKIVRVGDSLGVIIPRAILKAYHWQRSDLITFGFTNKNMLIVRQLTLEEIDLMNAKTENIDSLEVNYKLTDVDHA